MTVSVEARPVRPRSWSRQDWDDTARRAEASFRGELGHLRAWARKRFPQTRLRLFRLVSHAGLEEQPIGQAAVAVHPNGGGGTFLDRLHLEPGHEHLWPQAIEAVLTRLGAGVYQYGWEQNLEPPRESELASIPGVSVRSVRPLTVHSLEFSRWPDWESYERAISTNVRRNVKKAQTELPDLRVEWCQGRSALRLLMPLVRLRSEMYTRKGLAFRAPVAAASMAANILSHGSDSFTAVARTDDRDLAAVSGVRFGDNTYYLHGGSAADNRGASWLLLMQVFRRAYADHPEGRVVMGYLDESIHEESISGGLLRQRRSCRVSEVPTSTVSFDWAGHPG